MPTDEWIVQQLRGTALPHSGPQSRPAFSIGGGRRPIPLHTALHALARELPRVIRSGHTVHLAIAGWRVRRRRVHCFSLEIEASRHDVRTTRLVPHFTRGRTLQISSIGVPPSTGRLRALLRAHRQQHGNTLTLAQCEQILVELARETSRGSHLVGRDFLSTLLPKPGSGPSGCRFHPEIPRFKQFNLPGPHVEGGDLTFEVALTPWIVGPGTLAAPSEVVGETILDLGGVEFRVCGARQPKSHHVSFAGGLQRRHLP